MNNDLVLNMQMNCGKFQVQHIDLSESSVLSFGFAMIYKPLVLKIQINSGKFQYKQLDQIETGALKFKFAQTIIIILYS